MTKKLLPLFPPCKRYVEPFGGGASILLAREPVELEVYNDLNEALVNFFRVLAAPAAFRQFYRRVQVLPYSRALYNQARRTWVTIDDPIERAVQWFIVARQSFGGHFGHSWGSAVTVSCRGMAQTVSTWLSAIERLPEIVQRLSCVQFECTDWRVILERYDTPDTLFYCDPPYIHDTRRAERYDYELTDTDHHELVERLLAVEGKAVLSGYAHPIYAPLEAAGWQRHDFTTACFVAGRTRQSGLLGKGVALRKQPRTETAWVKPDGLLIPEAFVQ